MSMTKTQIAAWVAAGLGRESYEHHLNGVVTVYDVTAMRERAVNEKWPLVSCDINMMLPLLESRVFEEQRILDLSEDSWRNDPVMAVVSFEGNTEFHLMVDGIHRIIRRMREGLPDVVFYEARGPMIEYAKPGWGTIPGLDWGDKLVDGKIVKG